MGPPVKSFPKRLKRRILKIMGEGHELDAPGRGVMSYSQQGEDMILKTIFQDYQSGFYVDVGAHHPTRFSNTYFFYLSGWRGLNIDAMPGSMDPFRRLRPGDINLEYAVASGRHTLTYYMFNEPAVNGFSPELSRSRDDGGQFKIIGERVIETRTLAEIFESHLPQGQSIDFLTVDVEGLDLDVLRSNDWERFRPSIVLAEDLDRFLINQLDGSSVVQLLGSYGYRPCAKAVHTLVFVAEDRLKISSEGSVSIERVVS
jgi:FkbM family methyltransferase